MNQFYITTLGCKVNQYESDGIAAALTSNGWRGVDDIKKAEICIINTCAVTSRAAMQSRQEIRSIIRSNPEAIVVVTGCHAQTEPELVREIKNVHCVIGHSDKFRIAEAIIESTKGIDSLPFPEASFCSSTVFQGFEPSVTGNKTRAYLKSIIETAPIHRVRISSLEPKELTHEIIELVAANPIICDHFHIPLQSGDDEILRRMGRPYDTGYFRETILKIHETMPLAAIGIDVLQGFPGESHQAFERTHELLSELPISYLHVFPFSPRKKTPAFSYPDRVDSETLKQRCAAMRTLGEEKKKAFQERNIGKKSEAVIQEVRDSETGMLKAITSNYLTMLVEGKDQLKQSAVDVILETIDTKGTLRGSVHP